MVVLWDQAEETNCFGWPPLPACALRQRDHDAGEMFADNLWDM
jgi:hypothetical protein